MILREHNHGDTETQTPLEIVGVVADIKRNGLAVAAEPEQAARAEVKAFDPSQIIWRAQTLEELLGTSVAPRRFNMLLLGIFASVALVLAAVGLCRC